MYIYVCMHVCVYACMHVYSIKYNSQDKLFKFKTLICTKSLSKSLYYQASNWWDRVQIYIQIEI